MNLTSKHWTIVLLWAGWILVWGATPAFSQDELKASMTRGKDVYLSYCLSCHMENGEGITAVYPPLAKADYLMADRRRAIVQIIKGVSGPMQVNGVQYNSEMPAQPLSDKQVADVMNYILNSWGNQAKIVKEAEVTAARKKS